jgi:hypothetical protein
MAGVGGCSSSCFCDPRAPGGLAYGVCNEGACGAGQRLCSDDSDCLTGQACADLGCSQGTLCVDYTSCSSKFTPIQAKRELKVSVKKMSPAIRRAEKVRAAKLLTCRHKGVRPDQCET